MKGVRRCTFKSQNIDYMVAMPQLVPAPALATTKENCRCNISSGDIFKNILMKYMRMRRCIEIFFHRGTKKIKNKTRKNKNMNTILQQSRQKTTKISTDFIFLNNFHQLTPRKNKKNKK